jgi:hypothetical protein
VTDSATATLTGDPPPLTPRQTDDGAIGTMVAQMDVASLAGIEVRPAS